VVTREGTLTISINMTADKAATALDHGRREEESGARKFGGNLPGLVAVLGKLARASDLRLLAGSHG